jgi:hypothetical protein
MTLLINKQDLLTKSEIIDKINEKAKECDSVLLFIEGIAHKVSAVTMRQLNGNEGGMGDKVMMIEASTCRTDVYEKQEQD